MVSIIFAQSAGAVEYTDCTFASPMSVLIMTVNNLMVRFH